MSTRLIDRTLQEEWLIGVAPDAQPLAAGVAQTVTTGIQLPNDTSMSETDANRWLRALDDVLVSYQGTTNTGGAIVREQDVVIQATATGIVQVVLTNTGAPGSTSAGKLAVIKKHTATL